MRILLASLSLLFIAGCASKKTGVSVRDAFDDVRVEQMVGNNVTAGVFQRTVVCLNARRETRLVTAVTNVQVGLVTNASVSTVTNHTISMSTNLLISAMTNLAPVQQPHRTHHEREQPGPVSDFPPEILHGREISRNPFPGQEAEEGIRPEENGRRGRSSQSSCQRRHTHSIPPSPLPS